MLKLNYQKTEKKIYLEGERICQKSRLRLRKNATKILIMLKKIANNNYMRRRVL